MTYIIEYNFISRDLVIARTQWRMVGGEPAVFQTVEGAREFINETFKGEDLITKNPTITKLNQPLWTPIDIPGRSKGSHRLFKVNFGAHKDRYSIADMSGKNPDTTDDGPLLVAPNRECVVYVYGWSGAVPQVRARIEVNPVRGRKDSDPETAYVDAELALLRVLHKLVPLGVKMSEDCAALLAELREVEDMAKAFTK